MDCSPWPARQNARRRSQRARSGLTLIEVTVVFVIVSLLIAILLPFVQGARESSRRVQCRYNLMNLGFALHNYEHAFGCLPPGSVDDRGPVLNRLQGYHMSWIAQILPHLEHAGTYRQIDFRESAYHARNDAARAVVLTELRCPTSSQPNVKSLPSRRVSRDANNGTSGSADDESLTRPADDELPILAAVAEYAGCHHDSELAISTDQNGVLHLNSSLQSRDIPDGRSQTIIVGEIAPRDVIRDAGWLVGTRGTLRNTGLALVDALSGPRSAWIGTPLDEWGLPRDAGLTQAEEPEAFVRALRGDSGPINLDRDVGGFGSYHQHGAHFLLCDGSVRFIATHVDALAYRRLGNRRDGELAVLE